MKCQLDVRININDIYVDQSSRCSRFLRFQPIFAAMSRVTFQLNIAFTLPVNQGDNKVPISAQELWQGIKRGGRNPNDFADYVAACEVLSGGRKDFRRRLTLADGAVHTAKGAHLDQDVLIVDKLHVRMTSITFLLVM